MRVSSVTNALTTSTGETKDREPSALALIRILSKPRSASGAAILDELDNFKTFFRISFCTAPSPLAEPNMFSQPQQRVDVLEERELGRLEALGVDEARREARAKERAAVVLGEAPDDDVGATR